MVGRSVMVMHTQTRDCGKEICNVPVTVVGRSVTDM